MRLGNKLMAQGIITNEQVEEALKMQTQNPDKKIGEILIDLGYITKEELEDALYRFPTIPSM